MANKSIFYSWQTDLDRQVNLNPIKSQIRRVIKLANKENTEFALVYDEATRNNAGSPIISESIFKKIRSAELFICDISTINKNSRKRKVANPNVLIELGYAAALLGWSRIIMLYNKQFGNLSRDVPFDIAHRRISSFDIKSKSDKDGKKKLGIMLHLAISEIISKNPTKEYLIINKSDEEICRFRDIENLKWILSNIDLLTMDTFIENLPKYMAGKAVYFYDGAMGISSSHIFYIYDKKLSNLLNELLTSWQCIMGYSEYYVPHLGTPNFIFVTTKFDDPMNASKDLEEIRKLAIMFDKNLRLFLKYIRNDYKEIDLKELSNISDLKYQNYRQNKRS